MPSRRDFILLPGIDGEGFSFGRLLEQLASFVNPIVVTYPRDKVLGYAELLPMVLSRLPRTPFVLLGESFSSPLAIMIAASAPPGLRGLVLTSPFARNPLWSSPTWLSHLAHPTLFRLYDPYIRMKVWWRGDPVAGAKRVAALTGLRADVMASRVRSVLRVNALKELGACRVPVLYIKGRRDRVVHPRNPVEMLHCLPSMLVVELDAGHCVLKSCTDLAAAAIRDFVNRCCSVPSLELVHAHSS